MASELGEKLREGRVASGYTVRQVSDYMLSKGYKATQNTIYSWENDNSQPTPDALLDLCYFYEIRDVLQYFGYKNPPAPAEAETEDDMKKQLIDNYDSMNEAGQYELLKHSRLLLNDNQYKKCAKFGTGTGIA